MNNDKALENDVIPRLFFAIGNFLLTFLNPEININHAQLVFTTHDTWQLSNQLLRRDEIWFVEKDERGISTLYSLADFADEYGSRIRKDESYEKNYLVGKYGKKGQNS